MHEFTDWLTLLFAKKKSRNGFYQFQLRTHAAALCIDTKYKGGNDNFGLEPCVKDGQGGGEQVSAMNCVKCTLNI